LVLIILLLFSAAIVSRLIYVQLLNHEYWEAIAQGQQKSLVEVQGDRGEVFFQDMTGLAINQNFPLIYAVPNEIKNKDEAADMLSLVLEMDKDSILEKLKKDSFYEVLKKKLTTDEVNNVTNLKLTGIYLTNEKGRYYPFSNLASQVVGFLGGNGQGQYGIEGYYDDMLRGKKEAKELEAGPAGLLPTAQSTDSSSKGADLVLTLDYNIQFMAEQLLKSAAENLQFEEGEILVMDPNSGKILALADFPDFNPNQYSAVKDLGIFQDSSIQKIFEPGSVFKPITMAAALDQGKITPETKFTDTGSVKIGGHTIANFGQKTWGERTMTEVLEWSINTGAVFAEQQLDHSVFLDYIEKFGFFDKTGIDLQSEISSQNQELKKGYEVNFATAAFGQGIEMTSIQLARAFCAIANGGKLLRPYIVEKIVENGKTTETQPEIQNPSVISQKTASQLTLMMVNVVQNGYGKLAGVQGYYIAGKTGTAQVPEKGTYSPDKTIQSFIGFGPALDPRFLIFVKFCNPKAQTAEYSAAPVFGELAKYIIDYWKIPPDHEQ
jgi:cell division protein FtsI/penicillin-binding protein 2